MHKKKPSAAHAWAMQPACGVSWTIGTRTACAMPSQPTRPQSAHANVLVEIVARTCEHVIHGHDPAALYARAAKELESALDEAKALRVSVHPDALDDAQRAFDAAATAAGWTMPVELCGDAALALGTCVCEWDTGVFEADLRDQLRSLRRVIGRVLATPQVLADAC